MKSLLTLGTLAASLAISGIASAAGETTQRTLTPITVKHRATLDCTPPSSEEACAFMHAQIRHAFSKREIGMLFGARSSYPEYPISYARLNQRYQALARDLAGNGEARVAIAAR